MSQVVFIDRDHTILKGSNLRDIGQPGPNTTSVDNIIFLPNSLEALKKLAETNYKIVVVTNQADIARNLLTEKVLDDINSKMIDEIKSNGGRVNKVFHCPHKEEDNCNCRKPKTGMFEQAKEEFGIEDWDSCWLIGDSSKDMAVNLPLKKILVKTGYGGRDGKFQFSKPFYIAEDLLDAVEFLIASS